VGTYRTKEAEKAERDALVAQERGTLVDPKKTTVAELLDTWLQTKPGTVTPNSYKDYEIAIRRHLKTGAWHGEGASPQPGAPASALHRLARSVSGTSDRARDVGSGDGPMAGTS
jgi:hypothetical protein